jgi:hypothetical protein
MGPAEQAIRIYMTAIESVRSAQSFSRISCNSVLARGAGLKIETSVIVLASTLTDRLSANTFPMAGSTSIMRRGMRTPLTGS